MMSFNALVTASVTLIVGILIFNEVNAARGRHRYRAGNHNNRECVFTRTGCADCPGGRSDPRTSGRIPWGGSLR